VRSRALAAARAFFQQRGYIEVETPVRVPAPAMELHIDAPPSGVCWLRTSPELHMKRLLGAGCERLFQIGPCFREAERGARHNPEFTMLEWYRAGANYLDALDETLALLRDVAQAAGVASDLSDSSDLSDAPDSRHPDRAALTAPCSTLTVREAFRRWAGWDPVAAYDADRFDTDLVARIEPALPRDRPCVLRDYPAAAAALARRKAGDEAVAERWELYAGGLELANAYSELTDPREQRQRFLDCARSRQAAGRAVYPLDEEFLAALEKGLPDCAGVALGFDRLVMLLCGVRDIEQVRAFCPPIGRGASGEVRMESTLRLPSPYTAP
jgi:lysyl-tRNA synthetase class 2